VLAAVAFAMVLIGALSVAGAYCTSIRQRCFANNKFQVGVAGARGFGFGEERPPCYGDTVITNTTSWGLLNKYFFGRYSNIPSKSAELR